jgi:hypothetical protein
MFMRTDKIWFAMNLPFFHLRSRDIDTVRLSSTSHSEIYIERGQALSNISLWNDVECGSVIQDVIIQREFTT